MAWTLIHRCACSNCRSGKEHAHRIYHHQINLLLSRLNEPQRRWFAALEAMHIGHGDKQLMAQVTGLSPTTILRGCNELKADLADCPDQHLRASGGGRPAAEVKDPRLEDTLEAVLALETAGDPMGRRPKAKRSSLRHLSAVLKKKGHSASRPTVAKLLRKLDYSPKVNARRVEARGATPVQRNKQLSILVNNVKNSLRQAILSSVWTRKKRIDRQLQERWTQVVQVSRASVGA
jgi:hypothetical protein